MLDLAKAARVSISTIKRVEHGNSESGSDRIFALIQAAIEAEGVRFLPDSGDGPGMRLAPPSVGPGQLCRRHLAHDRGREGGPPANLCDRVARRHQERESCQHNAGAVNPPVNATGHGAPPHDPLGLAQRRPTTSASVTVTIPAASASWTSAGIVARTARAAGTSSVPSSCSMTRRACGTARSQTRGRRMVREPRPWWVWVARPRRSPPLQACRPGPSSAER